MKKKVLIVDDEEDSTGTLKKNLEGGTLDDIEVLTAPSAEEALATLTREPVSLLVGDIHMPGMSGLDLLPAVKARYPRTDVIIMTAYPSCHVRRDSAGQGSTRFIEKPFDMDELRPTIRLVLDKGPGFRGNVAGVDVRGVRLVDALKLIGLTGMSAAVTVRSGEREGVLFFRKGCLVHALCEEVSGEEALGLILEFDRGTITISTCRKPALQTLSYAPDDLVVESFLAP
jgi:DNA-binding response OmpR family regulator